MMSIHIEYEKYKKPLIDQSFYPKTYFGGPKYVFDQTYFSKQKLCSKCYFSNNPKNDVRGCYINSLSGQNIPSGNKVAHYSHISEKARYIVEYY